MQNKSTFISVIVPFFNARGYLRNCVQSLVALDYPQYEIILVDDGSTDDYVEQIKDLITENRDKVKVLRKKRGGPASARNLGIKNAQGEIIAFTDSDCTVDRDWLTYLVGKFDSEVVGAVQGETVTDSGESLYPVKSAPTKGYVTCNMAYKSETLVSVGLFDERFKFAFREDDDLAYKTMKLGWQIISAPGAIVYHPLKKLKLRDLPKVALLHQYDALLYKKHHCLPSSILPLITLDGLIFYSGLLLFLAGVISLVYRYFIPSSIFLGFILMGYLGLAMFYAEYRSKPALTKLYGAAWLVLDIMFIGIGRIIGMFKYKIFFV